MRSLLACAALAALLAGCGGAAATAGPGPTPAPTPPAAAVATIAPLDLGGQKVLVLPVQSAQGIGPGRDALTAEVVFALRDRDSRTQWVMPDALRRALSGSPGYAPDPATLPSDPYMHHRERQIAEPLAGIVRRYSALVDARLVVIPRSAEFVTSAAGDRGHVRLSAAIVDSRTGNLIWWGEADGEERPTADEAAIASAAAALAARMVTADRR